MYMYKISHGLHFGSLKETRCVAY